MDRLQNAQKSLAESLNALESVVLQIQNSASRPSAAVGSSDYNTPDAGGAARQSVGTTKVNVGQLFQEVKAIEADLDRAIQMITKLKGQSSSGDSR